MKYIDRSGNVYIEENAQDKLLRRLYTTVWGRILLKPLVCPAVSRAAGAFLDSRASRFLIQPFIRANHIDMKPYVKRDYTSYNDFFTREIQPEERMINQDSRHLVSPSDGKVSAYRLEKGAAFQIKNTVYSLESLLKDKKLAYKYKDGWLIIIRLTVDDYHRYCYPVSGRKSRNFHIPGVLHTVNPVACETLPVYKENTREYTVIRSPRFGDVLQMEVGALMVGRILNYHEKEQVVKGQEKGRFEFGGSTIILVLEKDRVQPDVRLLENTKNGYETLVKMGESIGQEKILDK